MRPLSPETVRRALRAADPFETTKARYGPRVARKLHGQFRGQIRADAPLNRIYMDHTQLDVFVRVRVAKRRWIPIRPWLTLVSDDCTGRVLGYALSFKAPKAEDVLAALRHAILPKAYTAQWVGTWLTFVWDVMGFPDELVIDNGMDLQAHAVYAACLAAGISVTTCPPMEPWRRARAERLFGTLNTLLIHTMEGTTLGRKDHKVHEHDPKSFATWDMDQLHIGLHVVFEKMATEWHKGLEDYPIRRWKEGVANFPVLLPRSRKEFDAQMSLRYTRTIGSLGIEFYDLHFAGAELTALKQRLGQDRQVTVLVQPEDIRQILVVDPQTLTTITAVCTTEFRNRCPSSCTWPSVARRSLARPRSRPKSPMRRWPEPMPSRWTFATSA